jgi:hypothetical protein
MHPKALRECSSMLPYDDDSGDEVGKGKRHGKRRSER